MKKFNRFLSVLLCAILIFTCFSFAVTAADECEHLYSATVVAPTCADKGYTLYTCSKCGDYYKADYTDAFGHTYGPWVVISEADCTNEGYEERECLRCHSFETKTVSLLDHLDRDNNGKCDRCGEKVDRQDTVAPFDWLKAFFKAVIEWFKAIFA